MFYLGSELRYQQISNLVISFCWHKIGKPAKRDFMPDKRDLKLVDISVHGPETRKSIETNDFLTYSVSCASLKYTRQKKKRTT